MRRIQIVFQAFGLLVMLPVFIVFVLEIAFSPLQPVARAGESHPVFEVNDIMLEEAGSTADAPEKAESESGAVDEAPVADASAAAEATANATVRATAKSATRFTAKATAKSTPGAIG